MTIFEGTSVCLFLCLLNIRVIVLIYRTGTITSMSWLVFSTLMTYSVPVVIAGDFNIHIERLKDSHSEASGSCVYLRVVVLS